jgi:hypothetical protein
MRITRTTLLAAFVIGLTFPRIAEAQTEAETQHARELFAEGVELSGNRQYEQAAAKFHEAYAIVQAPNIAYNLAVALVELGQVVEASEYVRAVLEDSEAPRDVQRMATQLNGTIESRVGRLTVTLIQSRGNAAIMLDGSVLDDDELGVAVTVNPGDHVVTAERGGTVLERQETTVSAGQSEEVLLDPTTWGSGASLDPELYDEAPPEEDDGGGGSVFGEWWFWTIVGVVVIGGAVAIGVAASSTEGPLEGNTSPAVGRF